MMHDVIERFRYRLQLWRREQRDDYSFVVTSKDWDNPKYKTILATSTPEFVLRYLIACFGVVGIVAIICRVVIAFIPAARFGILVGFIMFACYWTAVTLLAAADANRARKAYREDMNHLTNR
jgi:hypothetical protein